MNIDRIKLALIAATASFALVGCAQHSIYDQAGDSRFGEANRQTYMAQVIDPDPVYDTPVAAGNGAQAAGAVERYRTGTVTEPDSIRTTDVGGGGPN